MVTILLAMATSSLVRPLLSRPNRMPARGAREGSAEGSTGAEEEVRPGAANAGGSSTGWELESDGGEVAASPRGCWLLVMV